MEFLERYLHQVGKNLPAKGREDILAEIRSHLEDTLEERVTGSPTEEDVINLLYETGSPQKMAASFNPQSQYVIGPALYPLFRMVTGIALAATIGAQLLANLIVLWAGNGIHAGELIAGLVTSIPATIGWVVVVFMILQAYGVKPELDDEKWDPRKLPVIENTRAVSRGETIFGIVAGMILLALLVVMPDKIGAYISPGGEFYPNPVLLQYLTWIYASLAIGIGFNIYMLWQGQWNAASRIFELGIDVFSIVVLALLYKGHVTWLAAHGASGVSFQLTNFLFDLMNDPQLFGMKAFAMAFGVTLIVLVVMTLTKLVKIIIRLARGDRAEYSGKGFSE